MGKRVLFIVASHNFQPVEYRIPKVALIEKGVTVLTASDRPNMAVSQDMSTIYIDFEVGDVNPEDFDGVFIIGGSGAMECLDNEATYEVVRGANRLGKLVGAICVAPRILAKSGILKGRRATGWDGDGKLKEIFDEFGVTLNGKNVFADGKIITANGPFSSDGFGERIIRILGV